MWESGEDSMVWVRLPVHVCVRMMMQESHASILFQANGHVTQGDPNMGSEIYYFKWCLFPPLWITLDVTNTHTHTHIYICTLLIESSSLKHISKISLSRRTMGPTLNGPFS